MGSFTFGRHGAERRHETSTAERDLDATSTDEAAAVAGPGWYQSSWELRRGLLVHESAPPESPLHEWLLQHGRPPPSET